MASKHGVAGLAGAVFLDVRDRGVKVSLVSPGLVAAGAAMQSPAGRRPHQLLQPSDVAAAVRFVVTFPDTGCPTEITLQPQLDPVCSSRWSWPSIWSIATAGGRKGTGRRERRRP